MATRRSFFILTLLCFCINELKLTSCNEYELLGVNNKRFRRDTLVNSSVAEAEENSENTENIFEKDINHQYYTSTYMKECRFHFVDLSKVTSNSNYKDLKIVKHKELSKTHLKADRLKLPFPFYFYGNRIESVVLTTGGFLSVGPYFHSFANLVHYVAPLMANFNPSLDNSSEIITGSNSNVFIVQWKDMMINGSKNLEKKFNFQIMLFKNSSILLAYKEIPILPANLPNTNHQVTVGLADGYIQTFKYERGGLSFYRNYIRSYHKLGLPFSKVKSNSCYKLDLQPTCIQQKTCSSCLDRSHTTFDCKWCETGQLCSTGIDWNTQYWNHVCRSNVTSDSAMCASADKVKKPLIMTKRNDNNDDVDYGVLIGGIMGCLVFLAFLMCLGFFYYAFTHPQSKLGMWLIEHRRIRPFQNSNPDDDQLL